MRYCDAHIHLAEIPCHEADVLCANSEENLFCACAHSPADFAVLERYYARCRFVRSFGVHPQNPDESLLLFLRELLEQNRLDAIGESGFDFFTAEFAARESAQEAVWHTQLELAQRFGKPLVVHSRHALDRIFRDAKLLKPLAAVIFHSWPGSPQEGESLLKRGINAYFSLGKPLLNGNKRALRSAAQLPLDRILAETDAPYQTLKGETCTRPSDIAQVYAKIAEIRAFPLAELCPQLEANFVRAYGDCLQVLLPIT